MHFNACKSFIPTHCREVGRAMRAATLRKMHSLSPSISLRYILFRPRSSSLFLSLSFAPAMEFLGPESARAREGNIAPLNIYRPRGIEFCADECGVLTRKRGHYEAELRIGKTPRSLSRVVRGKIMRRRGRTGGGNRARRKCSAPSTAASSTRLFFIYTTI